MTEPIGSFVASEHDGKKFAVVSAFENSLPFVVGRNPSPAFLPTMEIGEPVGADLSRGALCHYGSGEPAFVFIEHVVATRSRTRGANGSFGELQKVTLADVPSLERGLRYDDAERIADSPNRKLHGADVITVITKQTSQSAHPTLAAGLISSRSVASGTLCN